MGYSPRSHKESDTTERLHLTRIINILLYPSSRLALSVSGYKAIGGGQKIIARKGIQR